jgi:hypothetical protein
MEHASGVTPDRSAGQADAERKHGKRGNDRHPLGGDTGIFARRLRRAANYAAR